MKTLNQVSMPHAALYVVQHHDDQLRQDNYFVSMPHAALYVVQHRIWSSSNSISRFNAARSIICGATTRSMVPFMGERCFNAARSIICGATNMG